MYYQMLTNFSDDIVALRKNKPILFRSLVPFHKNNNSPTDVTKVIAKSIYYLTLYK